MARNSDHIFEAYVAIETRMMTFDNDGDEECADALRDALDALWHRMGESNRQLLNSRARKD